MFFRNVVFLDRKIGPKLLLKIGGGEIIAQKTVIYWLC